MFICTLVLVFCYARTRAIYALTKHDLGALSDLAHYLQIFFFLVYMDNHSSYSHMVNMVGMKQEDFQTTYLTHRESVL